MALGLLCPGATRVALIGDSISTGAHAKDPAFNGYPARLGHLLGDGYEVRAFARGGHTLLSKGDRPLSKTPVYQQALAFAPEVAVIMLGTNDSCSGGRANWRHQGDLEGDLRAMISDLREANPEVVVHLAGPPPMYPEKNGLKPARVADLKERRPRLEVIDGIFTAVAEAEPGVLSHDLSRVFGPEQTSDGVHPDTFAHAAMAAQFAEWLSMEFDESFRVDVPGATVGDFHGYRRLGFRIGDTPAIVVAPRQAAEGRPWIWRARFFGHQPALDLQLLDRGWHVAYVDVTNLYGADSAMQRWDEGYRFLTGELGLGSKPVLEGMSRGGLPIFRWASRHPDRVAAVYGDNPVVDFRTWPGGLGGKRSDADWNRLLKAWNLTDSEAREHPAVLAGLESLAEARVPVALVLGTADEVVAPGPNGEALATRYAELGGPLKVWRKPGAGHHPHGLQPPDALRRYLLRATGTGSNPAVVPSPSSEYRAASQGWPKGWWRLAFEEVKEAAAAATEAEVVFLGDSITQSLTGHKDRLARVDGTRPIDRQFGKRGAVSLGLSGDRTQHLLWRIGHGQLDGLSPEWVVLMIGVNNINSGGQTGEETAEGTKAVVAALRRELPDARILMLGCFPAGKEPQDPRRAEVDALHEGIRDLADGRRVIYRDLRGLFLDPQGRHNDRMRGDGIHLSARGNDAWMEAVAEVLEVGPE